MNILGFEITRRKAFAGGIPAVPGGGGWWGVIRESFAGAWQTNTEIRIDTVLTYSAVFRCISLISSDIAKMRVRLMQLQQGDVWQETDSPAFSPVLRRPNHYQNRIQFYANWVESKLIHGNAYILKERDNRGMVVRLFVLDPSRVTPVVAPDSSIYYELHNDRLSRVPEETIVVPANEIIHDRWNTIHHPLVGTSPIFAAGVAATQGLSIQNNSTRFFSMGSTPGGVLSAPAEVSKEDALRLKDYWENEFGGGRNIGKVAVLGSGLKYEPMMIPASDAQLLEQLKWTAETVASVFGVPAYMIGIGSPPTYNNIEALQLQYYSQGLQIHIESIELGLDEGLGLPGTYGVEFDLDDLLRMDTSTKMKIVTDGVMRGILSPDEARARFSLKPVEGGDTPYLQEQNWPLRQLAQRDLPSREPTPPAEMTGDVEPDPEVDDDTESSDNARAAIAAELLRRSQPHYVPLSA